MQYQLRDYGVKPGEMEDWLAEWRTLVLPLRRQHGFDVVGAWTAGAERFVWIIGHDDFATADAAYYASPERAGLSPDPTRHLGRIDTTMMDAAADERAGG